MVTTLLLDVRGFVYKNLAAGDDPDKIINDDFSAVNSAAYGVTQFFKNTFPKLLALVSAPSDIIMCSDRGHSFRSKIYPPYKVKPADTSGIRDQLIKAEEMVVNIMLKLGATHVFMQGEEADDIIHTLCGALGGNKIVYTIDKDLICLHSKSVTVYHDGEAKSSLRVKDGEEYFDVPHNFIPTYLSLVGDASDKIPGAEKFGKKAWRYLSDNFDLTQLPVISSTGSADTFKSDNEKLNKLLEKLAVSEMWRTSQALVALRRVGTTTLRPLQWVRKVHDEKGLEEVLTNYKLVSTLFNDLKVHCVSRTLVTNDSFDETLDLIQYLLAESTIIGFDYETTDKVRRFKELDKRAVDALNSTITGLSISLGSNLGTAFYFPVNHKDTDNISMEQLHKLFDVLERHQSFKVAHNSPFEELVTLSQMKRDTIGRNDTALLAHVLNENSRVGLKSLSSSYLDYKQTSYDQVIASARPTFAWDDLDSWDDDENDDVMEEEVIAEPDADMESLTGEQVLDYGCDDSIVTAILFQHLGRLAQVEGCFRHVMLYERNASSLLTNITFSGICVDWDEVTRQHERDKETMATSLETIDRVLREHKSHPDQADHTGLHAFYDDHEAYFHAKRTEAKASGDELLIARAKSLPSKSMSDWVAFMVYEPLTLYKKPKQFKLTVSQFNKLADYTGLPTVTSVSRKVLESWFIEHKAYGYKLTEALGSFLNSDGLTEESPLYVYGSEVLTELQPWSEKGIKLELTSPQFRQRLLYIMLGLPIRIRSKPQKGGFRSTYKLRGAPAGNATAIVNALIYDCEGVNAWKKEILEAMLAFNKAATRCSNYWTKWPVWACDKGRLHPYFRRLGTKTGRPTSNRPNFNSIDKKAETRACIVAPFKDWVVFSGDFANQEMRRLANVSQDAGLISAFVGANTVDLHSTLAVAGAHFLLPLNPKVDPSSIKFDGVTSIGTPVIDYNWYEEARDKTKGYPHYAFLNSVRDASKIVNFGVAYGVTPTSLSEQVRIPLEAAEMFFKIHEERFPGVPLWKKRLWDEAADNGHINMYNGIRRHCGDGLRVGKPFEISRWERQIANSDIQGWCGYYAGEMLGKVFTANIFGRLIDTDEGLKFVTKGKFRAVLYVNLYDELMGACHKDDIHELIHTLKPLMEEASQKDTVPQVTDWSFGKNWKEQIEVGKSPSVEKVQEALGKIFG